MSNKLQKVLKHKLMCVFCVLVYFCGCRVVCQSRSHSTTLWIFDWSTLFQNFCWNAGIRNEQLAPMAHLLLRIYNYPEHESRNPKDMNVKCQHVAIIIIGVWKKNTNTSSFSQWQYPGMHTWQVPLSTLIWTLPQPQVEIDVNENKNNSRVPERILQES